MDRTPKILEMVVSGGKPECCGVQVHCSNRKGELTTKDGPESVRVISAKCKTCGHFVATVIKE